MCGNFFNPHKASFLGNNHTGGLSSAALGALLTAGLAPELGAALGLGSSAATGLTGGLVGAGLGGLQGGGQGALEGGILGGVGGYLGGGGLSDITNGIGLTTNGISDLAPSLSSFGQSTGLSQLFGGTPEPTSNLQSFNFTGGASPDIAASAENPVNFAPGGASASYLPNSSTGAGATLAGGSSGGGFDLSSASTGGGLPSSSGAGGFNYNLSGNPLSGVSDIASGVGGSTPNFNYDISGNPAGASSYSIPQQFANAAPTGGSGMNFSNLFQNGGNQMLNGLARGGIGSLLSNNNNKGYNAEIGAGNAMSANYQPFLNTGQQANTQLADLYGLNGQQGQQQAQQSWQNTPGYQFALNQGINAVNADAAAKGQLLSGNNQRAIQDYGTGLAGQYYNQYLANLQNQQAMGINAAGGVSQGMNTSAAGQYGKSGNQANTQNAGLGTALNSIFPGQQLNWMQLLGGQNNPNSGAFSFM